jgi:hypothetical protein
MPLPTLRLEDWLKIILRIMARPSSLKSPDLKFLEKERGESQITGARR